MLANAEHGHLVYLFTERKSWLGRKFLGDFARQRLITVQQPNLGLETPRHPDTAHWSRDQTSTCCLAILDRDWFEWYYDQYHQHQIREEVWAEAELPGTDLG
ncbi:unnamed protein product [Pleuronectes platessa]|uniref:Uncharacterized protein n=1 Tax=Pleuronectes platessa TaxID=8262 RepID=A0A9N7Z4P0_PLEPL|nr:unnamed protein product [Pleuronectes platessa]